MRKAPAILIAALTAASAAACDSAPQRERAGAPADSAAAPEVRAQTDGLAVWRADGFTMLVPEDADIVPTDPDAPAMWAVTVAGPGFVREVDGGIQPGPPAYRLDAATYAKADSVALEEWVAALQSQRGEADGEAGTLVALAGEPALRTVYGSGLASTVTYWLERDGKIVELRLEEEPESPLSGIQRHIQSLMLSTFRWSGSTQEPGRSGE
jgi:hypothetical protein